MRRFLIFRNYLNTIIKKLSKLRKVRRVFTDIAIGRLHQVENMLVILNHTETIISK